MMVVDIVLGRVHRVGAACLLVAGIGYAAVSIGTFLVTMSLDALAIFHVSYIIPAVFVGPGVMIVTSIVVALVSKRIHWLAVLGFVLWIGCVGFAHLWVIAEASASV